MKVLYFSKNFGGPTTSFIYRQVFDISKTNKVLYTCNNLISKNIDGIDIKEIKFKQNLFLKLLSKIRIVSEHKSPHFSNAFNETVTAFSPDIIHLQFGYEAIRVLDNIKKTEIPIIISFRGYDASKSLKIKSYKKKLKYYLSRPNIYVISVCKALIQNLIKHKIKPYNQPLILYSNTDTNYFKPCTKTKKFENFTFLQVSSFREKKGHLYTIQAFKKFIEKNSKAKCKLIFTGEGKGKKYKNILSLIKELDLEQHICLLGWTNRGEVRELIKKSHVGILHSITPKDGDTEGIPNFLMECMALELPVVSSYHSGIPELIEDKRNGYLVKEKDINKLANVMSKIYHNWKLIPENRVKILNQFNREKHNEILMSFYQKISNKCL